MNRLKATMLCTFSFARSSLIGMIFPAAFLFFFTYLRKLAGLDIFLVFHLFFFGIVFYGRHNAFCISNSVSLKYRIISFAATAGAMCLLSAILTAIAYGLSDVTGKYSLAELIRYMVIGGAVYPNRVLASFFENLFFYISAVSFGSLVGSMRSAKGDGFALIMLAIAAAVIFGFAFLGQYFLTPAAWLCVIPAVMLRSRFSAVLLYIVIAVVSLSAAYLLTYGVQNRSKEEKA